jgi:MSHA biogenesis protein MshK
MKLVAALLGIATAQAAWTAPFADPTRPPVPTDGNQSAAVQGPRLESVLIAPDRRVAVINGQQVVVGARIAGGEVVRISESEVVIRGAEGVQTLKLVPEMRRPLDAPKKRTAP